MDITKRELSLDFTKPRRPPCINQIAPSLITPTLNLSTPELSKMISEDELAILTPNGISSVIPQSTNIIPSPLIPTTVNCNNVINTTNNKTSTNSGKNNNSNVENTNRCNASNNHANRKKRIDKSREIDMDKIEKKRERNRLAAKKCRQRKMETIEELRKTVSDWELKYRELELSKERELEALRKEVDALKTQLFIKN